VDPPPKEILQQFEQKTSKDTQSYMLPPTRTKMLVRDFIDDCLYNPHYGFYAKPSESVLPEFEEMEQEEDHLKYMSRLAKTHGRINHHHVQHLRYTLTELFKVNIQ
jgi:hypothetical protein